MTWVVTCRNELMAMVKSNTGKTGANATPSTQQSSEQAHVIIWTPQVPTLTFEVSTSTLSFCITKETGVGVPLSANKNNDYHGDTRRISPYCNTVLLRKKTGPRSAASSQQLDGRCFSGPACFLPRRPGGQTTKYLAKRRSVGQSVRSLLPSALCCTGKPLGLCPNP